MKKLFFIIGICFSVAATAQSIDTLKAEFLKENIQSISSIDPDNHDYDDLAFLQTELRGVEIMLLGEQGHGDGSTFLAKTRLIKYLHEEMGYNVLAFESGLYDCYRVWEAIQNGADSVGVFNLGIFPVWAKSEQVQPLFQYILEQSKTDNPLMFTGFDMQPTGNQSSKARFDNLNAYLSETLESNWSSKFPLFDEVFQNTRKIFANPLSEEKAKQLTIETKGISRKVAEQDKSIKGQVIAKYVLNYLSTITLFSKADLQDPSNTPHVFNLRDNQMAENFELIKEVLYPGEKIIAWGANTHFGYGRGLLGSFEGREAPEQGMVPAGQYLKIDYGKKMYSLAFTSYKGKYGMLNREAFTLPEAKPASLEFQLNGMGAEYAFLSLRNKELSSKRFVTTAYGHSEMSGRWAHMADGIFFIRNMEASKFK